METDILNYPSELIVNQIKVTGTEIVISYKSDQLHAKLD